jgi:hypothetical protein
MAMVMNKVKSKQRGLSPKSMHFVHPFEISQLILKESKDTVGFLYSQGSDNGYKALSISPVRPVENRFTTRDGLHQ